LTFGDGALELFCAVSQLICGVSKKFCGDDAKLQGLGSCGGEGQMAERSSGGARRLALVVAGVVLEEVQRNP